MNTLPITPFNGEYLTKIAGGPDQWRPCEVVGVLTPDGPAAWGKFVVLVEDDDGTLYTDAVDAVRRPPD